VLLWWGSLTVLLSACGAATRPAGDEAAEEPPATDHDDAGEPGDEQVALERTPECLAQCRKLIEGAEALLRQAGALKVPRYSGPQTVDGVDAYIGSALAAWARQRQQLVSEAQTAYQKVIAIRPVPPSRWVVAALARTGELWRSFAEEFTSAKLPDKLARDADTQAAFERALQRSAEPAREAAQRSFSNCRRHAERFGLPNQDAAACE
jgi:hypothetical protein